MEDGRERAGFLLKGRFEWSTGGGIGGVLPFASLAELETNTYKNTQMPTTIQTYRKSGGEEDGDSILPLGIHRAYSLMAALSVPDRLRPTVIGSGKDVENAEEVEEMPLDSAGARECKPMDTGPRLEEVVLNPLGSAADALTRFPEYPCLARIRENDL